MNKSIVSEELLQFVKDRLQEGNSEQVVVEILYFEYVNNQITRQELKDILHVMSWECADEFMLLTEEEAKVVGLDGVDHLFRKIEF